jgi:hypothetical protein
MTSTLSLVFFLAACCTLISAQWKTATTTRYWDCNQPYCEPGKLPYPHSYAMQTCNGCANGATIFGTAAASDSILQGNAACEKCYVLQKSGTPSVIVKVNNWCPCQYNPSCCSDHFDIAVPGFDWAAGSVSNVCQQSDPTINYAGGHQQCQNWYLGGPPCDCSSVSTDPVLQKGCSLFMSLQWDNPSVQYQEVTCPTASQLGGTVSPPPSTTPPPPPPPPSTPPPPPPPPSTPPPSSTTCSGITPAYDPTNQWWVEINAPSSSTVSVQCTGSTPNTFSCVANYGKYQCAISGNPCAVDSTSTPRYAIVNGVKCRLTGAVVVVSSAIEEDGLLAVASDNSGSDANNNNAIPTYAIAVIATMAVVCVALIIAVVGLVIRMKNTQERV